VNPPSNQPDRGRKIGQTNYRGKMMFRLILESIGYIAGIFVLIIGGWVAVMFAVKYPLYFLGSLLYLAIVCQIGRFAGFNRL